MNHAALSRFVVPAALAGLAGCGLAGCSPLPPISTNCPNVAVLEQGSSLTEFLPGRQDIAAEIASARITGVAGSCALLRKKHALRVAFKAAFAATSGPAATGQTLVLPYLVSLSQGDTLLSTASGAVALNFNGNASTAAGVTEMLKYNFPDTPATASIDVLVSFHLTPGQIAYNAAHPPP